MLETLGVPVIGYGTDELPAFYTATSGLALTQRADSAARRSPPCSPCRPGSASAAARWSRCRSRPPTRSIPRDVERLDRRGAGRGGGASRVTGKAITPFLLQHLADATGGASLKANVALARNNARVAAEIAVALRR